MLVRFRSLKFFLTPISNIVDEMISPDFCLHLIFESDDWLTSLESKKAVLEHRSIINSYMMHPNSLFSLMVSRSEDALYGDGAVNFLVFQFVICTFVNRQFAAKFMSLPYI